MDKKKIIIIGAVAVLIVGGIIAFSVLNKEDEYEIPTVNETVIPEYDHSANPEDDKNPSYNGNLNIDNNATVDEGAVPINPEDIDKIAPDEDVEKELDEMGNISDEDILDVKPDVETVVVPEIKDSQEKPEGYDEFLEMLEAMNGSPNEGNTTPVTPDEPIIQEDPTISENPIEDTGLTTRTDTQTKQVINNFVDNFKNTSTFNNLDSIAAQYLDENLNTLKNNPESNRYLNSYITSYKNGAIPEDMFIYAIESWIKIAGPYGGKEIVIE